MSEKDANSPGYKPVGFSLHTSTDRQLKQLSTKAGVSKSRFISDLIEKYGPALVKKYLPEG